MVRDSQASAAPEHAPPAVPDRSPLPAPAADARESLRAPAHGVSQHASRLPRPAGLAAAAAARTPRLPARCEFHPVGTQPMYTFAPRRGIFRWTFDPPPGLREQWQPRVYGVVTKGAVMSFEADNGMPADGIAGPRVWKQAALDQAPPRAAALHLRARARVAARRRSRSTRSLSPVFQAPANTGIAEAPHRARHLPRVSALTPRPRCRARTPTARHYNDPGVPSVSYFNGGDAVHGFPRPSYGSPQSLGCVELSFGDAAQAYELMTYGTLVTVAAS